MNQTDLLEILKDSRLMQTQEQMIQFENTLADIVENPNDNYLPQYHLILDDKCQHPEVMFSLIHFLESFDVDKQIAAFIKVIPQLMIHAPEWVRIIHHRILNDQSACHVYQKLLHSVNLQTPHFIYFLLEENLINYLNLEKDILSELKMS